jgi:hypothetical protein
MWLLKVDIKLMTGDENQQRGLRWRRFLCMSEPHSVRLGEMLSKVFKLGAVSANYARIFKSSSFLLNKERRWESGISAVQDGMRRVFERKR